MTKGIDSLAMTKAAVKLKATGLSQAKIAKALGVSQGFISKVFSGGREAGGGPRTAAFRKFGIPPTDWDEEADVIDVPPEVLP